MPGKLRDKTSVRTEYEPLMRQLGFGVRWVFEDPSIVVWRKLDDRENCTLDVTALNGRPVRLHVKRYAARSDGHFPGEEEACSLRTMEFEKVPCPRLVAWGVLTDGRSFSITEDLLGYQAADKMVEGGQPFEKILYPTADLAARLHKVGLHHRDLYLCHFFIRVSPEGAVDAKLIDAARVSRLPNFFFRRRWIVKDLAQFWFSTLKLPITDDQRRRWLGRYAEKAKVRSSPGLRRAIEAKARRIAAHDVKLTEREPGRHISIPAS
jgi:Lipopolysaccharide kinase (Kdo/WaaP) family